MSEKNLTYFEAVRLVLLDSKRPLMLHEIEREILQRQLRDSVVSSGMRSVIYKDIYKGSQSTFFQNEDGSYDIRKQSVLNEKGKDNSNDDKVLVFDTNMLHQIGYFQGINPDSSTYETNLLNLDNPVFMSRKVAEEDSSYKQIVSYVIVIYKDRLLRFTRHKSKRNKFLDYLDGKFSIGFGGHVQEGDLLFSKKKDSGYSASLVRELFEESMIHVENVKSIKTIGVLNDDSTPRGKCHFAFVHLVKLATLSFRDKDKYVNDLKMVSFQEISDEFASYEWWSKLCLQFLFPNKLKFDCFIDTKRNFKLKEDYKYLAIVGEISSGKSRVCAILSETYGYIHVPCSKIMREIIGPELKNMTNRLDIQNAGEKFINSPNAHEIFADRLEAFIENYEGGHRFIFDGLRYPETYLSLQKKLGKKIPVIYVATNKNMQYKNYLERENETPSFEQFMKILGRPVENQIQRFLPYSKIIILNHSTFDSLEVEVKKYFDREIADSSLRITWNQNAKFRHEQILRGNDLTFSKIFVPQFIKQIKETKDYKTSSVLDIGCGTGILTEIIAEHVGNVIGVDYSCESINIARLNTNKKNVRYECTEIENYHPRILFDTVISNMTFHTVENIQKVIQNVYRLLIRGGRLIFSLPHPRYYPLRERVRKIFLADGYDYNKESFHKIPFTISREPEPLPSLTPYFHRPFDFYDDLLFKDGFILLDSYIPFPDNETLNLYPDHWTLPHILFGVARKT
jgi:predicted NUDIX family phosphoesterase/2-polyprenyl-3-methyl-5-hydroxy-6-metoxy-1,4-benzoquinol methylase